MRLILILTVLLLAVVSPVRSTVRSTYFDCVVTNVGAVYTVKCDTPNKNFLCNLPKNKTLEECEYTVLDIPKEYWNEFPNWHYETADYPTPVKALDSPYLGQVLKATIGDNSDLVPLKPCNARALEALKYFCRDNDYCRPPNALYTPYGCGWPQTAFIKAQLAQVAHLKRKK